MQLRLVCKMFNTRNNKSVNRFTRSNKGWRVIMKIEIEETYRGFKLYCSDCGTLKIDTFKQCAEAAIIHKEIKHKKTEKVGA